MRHESQARGPPLGQDHHWRAVRESDHRHVLLRVREAPLPLEPLHVDSEVRASLQRIDVVLHRPREAEEHEDDHHGDRGVDDLERDDVLALVRHVVAATPPVPQHAPQDERHDERADDDRGDDAGSPQIRHPLALRRSSGLLSERRVARGAARARRGTGSQAVEPVLASPERSPSAGGATGLPCARVPDSPDGSGDPGVGPEARAVGRAAARARRLLPDDALGVRVVAGLAGARRFGLRRRGGQGLPATRGARLRRRPGDAPARQLLQLRVRRAPDRDRSGVQRDRDAAGRGRHP